MPTPASAALPAGAQLTWARVRGRGLWLLALLSLALPVTVALIELHWGTPQVVTRVVMTIARWVLPLAAFSLMWQVRRQQRLDDALWPLARFGWSRRQAALGAVLAAAAIGMAVALLSCAAALLVSWSKLAGLGELWTCLWVCALGALAYVAVFALAGSYGRGGRACWALLLADFFFGSGDGWLALPWPRAHIRSLLGGGAVFELTQASSSVVLLLLSASALLWMVWRMHD